VLCCGFVGLSFLTIVWFGLLQRMHAAENALPDRQVSAAPTKIQPKLVAGYGKLPLSFEANQGQTDARVRFLARGGYTIFLTDNEAVLTLKKSSVASGQLSVPPTFRSARDRVAPTFRSADAGLKSGATASVDKPTTDNGPQTKGSVLGMKLVGANAKAIVTGAGELPGKSNYFIGNDPKKWRTNVPTYAKVMYQDVYPGVDLAYYGNLGGQLEYDFVIAPGADPNRIKLSFAGADGMRVDAASGDLVLKVGADEVRFQKPAVYQPAVAAMSSSPSPSVAPTSGPGARHSSLVTRHCSFVLSSDNEVGFRVAGYDPERALVIDPVLSYSTFLGGSSTDSGQGIAVDSSGNAYVTGYTQSSDFPTVNPIQAAYAGPPPTADTICCNVFVAKLNPAGSALVYSTYLGGSGGDQGFGIAVDSAGNAYVTGRTYSTDFPTVNPLQATNKAAPVSNAFVAKLNPAGSALVYSTYLGGSGINGTSGDAGYGIAADSSGNAYVTGETYSTDFPTANALQATHKGPGSSTAFVATLNSTGSALVYSTYLGGSGGEQGFGIAVDSAGNAYVTGVTGSTDFPTVNPLQATNNASEGTCFVARLNAAGSALVYSTYLGGSESDSGTGIAVDSSGNAYVTGRTDSGNFPTANPIQATCKGGGCSGDDDAFVAELNAAGSALVYSTFLGGSGIDEGYGIAVDSSGNAYVTGWTTSRDFPTANPIQPVNLSGKYDYGTAFVAKLNSNGSALVYSTYLGGSGGDWGYGIAADSSGAAYVTGYTGSTDFPTVNPLQATLAGGYDAFVAKIGAVTLSPTSLSFSNQMVGTTSPAQPVTLSNLGNAKLTISSIAIAGSNSGDFAVAEVGTTCSTSVALAAGTSCTINVTFAPTIAGSESASLSVSDSIPGSLQTVQLTGTGIVSAPTVSPGSLSFNSQLVGTTSASQPVTVTNTGSLALSINSLAISSGWTQSNSCLPSIAPSASCTINVSFQPTAGGSQTGTLTLTDYALNSPQTVNLSGTGLVPVVSLSATSLSFAGQTVSTPSAPQTLTLSNTGTGALTPLTITASGDFSQTNTCGATMSVGAKCTISVTFKPAASGTRIGTLSISDNALDSPQSVALSGTGQDFTLAAASGSPTSDAVAPGQSATYTLTMAGEGGFNQSVSLTCTGAPSEATCTVPNPVTAGSSATNLTVTVTTTAPSASAPRSRPLPPVPPRSPGLRGLLMLALALAAMAWAIGRRNQPGVSRWKSAMVLLASGLLLTLALAGCGGGGSSASVTPNPGTPSGTYTLTVTGSTTSGSVTLSHSVTLTLTVS
jgi:hypothetical protein